MKSMHFLALILVLPACDNDNDEFEPVCCRTGNSFIQEFTEGGVCELGESAEKDELCKAICCDRGGGLIENTSVGECAAVFGRTAEPAQCEAAGDAGVNGQDAGGGGACRCDDPGVSFSVVSGCEGPAFADATQPGYCNSTCVELRGGQANCSFTDGEQLGFPRCQVAITCP